MKLSIALSAILSAALTTAVQANPMTTCKDQANCLVFTTNQVPNTTCIGEAEDCEFVVCMTVNFGGSCSKTGTISHTCEKKIDQCNTITNGFFGITATPNIGDNYSSCQTVKAGGTAEFLMKDGSGSCEEAGSQSPYETASGATCQSLENVYGDGASCTGNKGMECIWTVVAPASCVIPVAVADETFLIARTADEEEIVSVPVAVADEVIVIATTAAEEAEYLCV
jgi:hypothetical protein